MKVELGGAVCDVEYEVVNNTQKVEVLRGVIGNTVRVIHQTRTSAPRVPTW